MRPAHLPPASRWTICAALVAFAAARPAAAQEAGQEATQATTQGGAQAQQVAASPAETIVVQASRRNQTQVVQGGELGALGEQRAIDVPFSLRSYTASLILNQQSETLGQVLENDPSVRTTLGFGNFSEQFVIRGFPLDGDDVSIDGLYGVAPRQLVAPDLYDQVQILNGANAFLNGAAPGGSGIGGGVNLVMKRAGDAPLSRASGSFASGSLGGGAVDVGRRFGPDHAFGVRINVSGRSGDTAVEHEHHDSLAVGGGFDWRGERARVSLDVAYQDEGIRQGRPTVTVDPSAGGVPTPPDPSHNYGQPWTYTRLRDTFALLHGEYDLAPDLTLYAAAGARHGNEEGDYSSITVTNAATGAGTATSLFVPRNDENESVRGGVRASFRTGFLDHRLDLGGSGLWETGDYAYAQAGSFDTNLYATPVVAHPPVTSIGGDLGDPATLDRTRLESAYLSDTASMLDGRVRLIAGFRAQNIYIKSFAYSGGVETLYNEDAVTPVVGLVIRPTAHSSIYFNRIEGLAEGPSAPSDVANAGQIFPPYTSVQYEVGAKYEIRRLSASIALYQISEPSAFTQPSAGGALPVFVEDGEQRNRGIEFNLSGEPVRGLRLIGGVSINDAVLSGTAGGAEDGNTAIGVPNYYFNGNLEWDVPQLRGATLTGRVISTGRQEVDAANTLQIPGWARFDIGGRYTFLAASKPVTLRLGIDNVADRRYWASSFGGYLLQGTPRTFKLSLSVDL